MKIYLVSAKNGDFVAFTSAVDAKWTATGRYRPALGTPTLGDEFRNMHAPKKTFPMITLELTDDQVKLLKIPALRPGSNLVCA